MKGKKVTVVFGVLRRALLKKKIRAWRRRIIQARSDKPSRSSQHIQADIFFVLPKLFSFCFIFFLFSLDQIIYDCKWLTFMLIKSDYDVFIILLLSLYYSFVIWLHPHLVLVVTTGLMWFIYALFLLLSDVDYLFYMLHI